MKTTAMEHQVTGISLLKDNPEFYGLGAEQGTGKTWMLMADIERSFEAGDINAAIVIAPKGVHTNWIRREIPEHMELPVDCLGWVSGPNVGQKREMKRILTPRRIRGDMPLLSMNIDAVNTPTGFGYLRNFLRIYNSMLIIDESSKIKTPRSRRTKKLISVAPMAISRRIASGTMMPNGPPDLFSQMEFLSPYGRLLGTSSFRSFMSEYAEVLPSSNPVMEHIIKGMMARRGGKEIPKNQIPQKVATYPDGTKRWKNLDKLQELLKPYVFRVLKKDCLDLPDKIYQTYGFQLPSSQRKVYQEAEKELRYWRDTGQLDTFTALTKIMKLRQIVSGFIMLDGEPTVLMEKNPRMNLFKDLIEDLDGQFIVWAQFREEIVQIASVLKELGFSCVQYHGGVKTKDREAAVDDFQSGRADVFIGQTQAAGIGLTLTAATTSIYYSNDYNYETRSQSEDRNHRIGTTQNVLYIDLVAEDTIDERIVSALKRKEEVSDRVLNYV